MNARPATMGDLKPDTRVRHVKWDETGWIRVTDGIAEIVWDEHFGVHEVSPSGPVYPSDLEIIGRAR